jgi:hypothetical protein
MRARAKDATSSNDIEFIFEENFGAALPTGSTIIFLDLFKCLVSMQCFYLNPGTGKPCAGQLIAIDCPRISR